jgi:Periplasmic binding protein-like domain
MVVSTSPIFTAENPVGYTLRKKWFNTASARHGLTFEAEGHGDYSYDSGFKEASLLLRRSKFDELVCGNDVMAIGARDAAISLLNRHVPGDLAIVGQDGITMASWECNDLTSLALDHVAFIDAIVQLIERRETRDGAAPNHCSQMHGFGRVQPPTHRKIGETPLRVRTSPLKTPGSHLQQEIARCGRWIASSFGGSLRPPRAKKVRSVFAHHRPGLEKAKVFSLFLRFSTRVTTGTTYPVSRASQEDRP